MKSKHYYCVSYLVGDRSYDIFVYAKDEEEATILAYSEGCTSIEPTEEGLINENGEVVELDCIKPVPLEDVPIIGKYTSFIEWADCLEAWFDKTAILSIKGAVEHYINPFGWTYKPPESVTSLE